MHISAALIFSSLVLTNLEPSELDPALHTGDVLELSLRSLNVSVACEFCSLLLHVITVYDLGTVVDSCFIIRSHVFSSSSILH